MTKLHMDCPRCGSKEQACDICVVCGLDVNLYQKANHMSAAYYNKGLKFANAGNLTACISYLQSSLQINKKNISARNLLGLCFYAVGRVGDALREWVISSNYESKDNPAQSYLDGFHKDMPILEKNSEGLKNYNEALQFIFQRSEDLATIRLKRAIEVIPNFVEAMNLLALIYLKNGDKTKAGGLVERVLAIDSGSVAAKMYYREIFQRKHTGSEKFGTKPNALKIPQKSGASSSARSVQQKNAAQNPFAVQNQKVFAKSSPISGILSFVAGLGAMFLFMYILVFPSFLEENRAEIERLETETQSIIQSHKDEILRKQTTISALESDIEAKEEQILYQAQRNLVLQNENWVNLAHGYLMQEMPEEALSALENVDLLLISADYAAMFSFVRAASMPLVEEHYYQIGLTYFNSSNFAESRVALERAAQHITPESQVAHHIFYFLGRIAEVDGDIVLARTFYETIIADFPGSNRVNPARNRLNIIS